MKTKKRFFQNRSLGTRLTVAIAGTSLFVLTLAAIILVPVELEKFKHNRLYQGRVIMDAYGAQFVQMVQLNTAEQAVNMSSQLSGFPDMLSLYVDNKNGQRIFTYTGEHTITADNLLNLQPFVVEQPLSYMDREYGRVGLTISATGYEAAIMPYLGMGSALIVGLFSLALLIARWQNSQISGPISELAEELEHLQLHSSHNMKIDSNQAPEIKVLYEGFNRFIKTITKAQNALLEQKHALDVSAIVSIADISGKITYANDLFYQASGYQLNEVIGSNHRLLNSGHHDDAFFVDLWKTISSGKVWRGEVCNRTKVGKLCWHDTTIVPFSNEGKLYQYMAIRFDISPQKALEKMLITARQQAESANQSKSEFLSSMSHELRTPLNAILGFSELMSMDDTLDKEIHTFAKDINKAGQHLLMLIDEVLDLSVIESGNLQLSLEAISLQQALEACNSLGSVFSEQHDIQLNFVADRDYTILADATRLKQVLINLLSNAIKYNRKNGSVTVSYEVVEDNQIRINVADTGLGIEKAQQERLFQPFERLGAEHGDIQGTGIGLAITKQLVELMGGSIGVDSSPGIGSTFWVTLNLTAMQTADDICYVIPKAGDDLTYQDVPGKHLIYIEDNPANIRLIKSIIEHMTPHKLTTAHEPGLGLALVNSQLPDMVLLDINLPGMSAFAVLKQLRKNSKTRNIPVIAISAKAMPHDIEKGYEAGFDDYVTKPISVNRIVGAINSALNMHS